MLCVKPQNMKSLLEENSAGTQLNNMQKVWTFFYLAIVFLNNNLSDIFL